MTPIVPLTDADAASAGGKAAVLGHLRRAGLPVPDGVVVPAAHDLDARGVRAALGDALEHLGGGPFAVRSSAADEDGATESAAGRYDSVLGARGLDAVVAAVRACRASATGPRAAAARAGRRGVSAPAVGVLVQRLVGARAAGVAFTSAPDGAGAEATVVEASWGLGPSVVQGAVDPDRFVVAGPGPGRVARRRTGSKRTRVDRSATGVVTTAVAAADRDRPCLHDAEVLRVAALAARVAELLGGPQDVEWAVDHDGVLWLLQARPVTAALPRTRCGYAAARESSSNTDHLRTHSMVGTPASGGRTSGPVRIVHGPDDVARVRPGDVLVCRQTDPAWTPLFYLAAAVVTETGGLLSHAAIVARELRLPAVLGVPGVVRTLGDLPDGAVLTVDGDAGTVTATGA